MVLVLFVLLLVVLVVLVLVVLVVIRGVVFVRFVVLVMFWLLVVLVVLVFVVFILLVVLVVLVVMVLFMLKRGVFVGLSETSELRRPKSVTGVLLGCFVTWVLQCQRGLTIVLVTKLLFPGRQYGNTLGPKSVKGMSQWC
jgi:hypothetical protein